MARYGHGKKGMTALLLAALLLLTLIPSAQAETENPSFRFSLLVNGETEAQVQPGDIIALLLRLERTDSGEPYTMYAMQDEVVYDPQFLQLLPENSLTAEGVRMEDVAEAGGIRACYFAFAGFDGGAVWQENTVVAVVQFRVVGQSGASVLCSRNYLVSQQDGRSAYDAVACDVTVVVSETCSVAFESGGGSPLPSQTVTRGRCLSRPDDPVREGYRLTGWYKDPALTRLWDFDADTVTANMTLYAGWEAEEAPETPEKRGSIGWVLAVLPAAMIALWVCRKRRKSGKTV